MANPTIGATTPRIQYTATGGQTAFTVPFEFLANADLAVYVNGTLQTLTTHYTLTGANTTGGGTCTFVSGRTAGDIVTIIGNLAYSRSTNKYTKFGLLPAEVLEADFDALQVQAKQLALADQFAIRAPMTDSGTPSMTLPAKATRSSKVLAFDSSGNPSVSANNIAAIDAATTAINTIAAASSGNSASISHIASGTGATSTTVQAKLREIISVKDFGAVGDGSTDDTAAIQACIDAAPTGSTIYFPTGKYVVSASLTTGNKTLVIQGAGYRASVGSAFGNSQYTNKSLFSGSVIFSSVTSGVAFDCNPLSSWAVNLRDIAIVGPGSGTSIGIRQKSQTAGNTLTGNIWWNVGVFNFSKCYEFSAVLNSTFTRLRAVGCTVGFEILPYSSIGSNNNTFIDLETYFTDTYAFYAIDCAGLRLIGPLIQNMSAGGKGIYLTESTANNANDHVILNAWLEHGSGTYDSIYINGGRNIHVLDAHGAGSARIVVAAGTKHRITGARLTGTGNVIEIASGVTYATVEQSDLESGGTVLDNGTYTQIDMLYQTETAANIASTTASINTTNKFTGKVVWDSTNNRVMRSSGAGTSDPWVALDGHVSITPNTLGGSGNVIWKSGSGTPEGSVTAPVGSLYTRTNGGANTTLYIKESGTGNTGWVAK